MSTEDNQKQCLLPAESRIFWHIPLAIDLFFVLLRSNNRCYAHRKKERKRASDEADGRG